MKKIIVAAVALLISVTTFAQDTRVLEQHLISVFPKQMPQFVYQNSEAVAVSKKLQKQQYMLTDGHSSSLGYLREGDTVLVFRGVPWFSKGTGLMVAPQQSGTAKAPRERRPMNPETKQVILQVGTQAAQQLFWQMSQRQRW